MEEAGWLGRENRREMGGHRGVSTIPLRLMSRVATLITAVIVVCRQIAA
jgi:hypothetical protein